MKKISIDNCNELSDFLKKKLGKRYELVRISRHGFFTGKLDGVEFTIALYPHKACLVSTPKQENKAIVDELVPYLTRVMEDNGPMCRYNIRPYGVTDAEKEPHIEWNYYDADERLKELANNRGVSDRLEVVDLEILNGKNIADYLDTEEEKASAIKGAKIYGIHSGCIDPEKAVLASEADIFFLIRDLERQISQYEALQVMGLFMCEGLDDMRYGLDYLKYFTTRFGVEMAEPMIGKRVNDTTSFNKWFNFYENHFKEFSQEQWDRFVQLRNARQDVTEYLPTTSWKDAINLEKKPNGQE